MTSPIHKTQNTSKRRRSRQSPLDFSVVQVHCSFCGNTFSAPPQDAVCPKCSRPANRPLKAMWRALSLLVPPLGLIYALIIRSHSPVAAFQGFKWTASGAFCFGLLTLLEAVFNIF